MLDLRIDVSVAIVDTEKTGACASSETEVSSTFCMWIGAKDTKKIVRHLQV